MAKTNPKGSSSSRSGDPLLYYKGSKTELLPMLSGSGSPLREDDEPFGFVLAIDSNKYIITIDIGLKT